MLRVLDSTVLIDYMRGRPAVERVREARKDGDRIATTPINIEEVVRGLRPTEVDDAITLFAGLDVLAVIVQDGWRAGNWRREHAGRGITLWQSDCLIAAVALRSRASLATGNPKDFPMPELSIEHWPVGE
jgi:predicted nucleic acid-binding protein